jgi:hypothetical protein
MEDENKTVGLDSTLSFSINDNLPSRRKKPMLLSQQSKSFYENRPVAGLKGTPVSQFNFEDIDELCTDNEFDPNLRQELKAAIPKRSLRVSFAQSDIRGPSDLFHPTLASARNQTIIHHPIQPHPQFKATFTPKSKLSAQKTIPAQMQHCFDSQRDSLPLTACFEEEKKSELPEEGFFANYNSGFHQ